MISTHQRRFHVPSLSKQKSKNLDHPNEVLQLWDNPIATISYLVIEDHDIPSPKRSVATQGREDLSPLMQGKLSYRIVL